MADDRGLTRAIGDALVALVDFVWPDASRRFDDLFDHAVEAVRPDPPMSIRTTDGLVLTGLLVCDTAGRVILFVGTRAPASAASSFSSFSRPDPRETRRYDDGSVPLWGRDVDPRDLQGLDVDPYRRR